MTIANLRGLRESGNIFAIPTYLFVGLALLMVGLGMVNIVTGAAHPIATPERRAPPTAASCSIFLLLKAFAGGSVALTGVEAIANGVPAFKPPEAKNAANTMTAMAILLGDPVHRDHRHRPRLRDPAHRRRHPDDRVARRRQRPSATAPSCSSCSRPRPR